MSPEEFKILRLSVFMTPGEIADIVKPITDESFDKETIIEWENSSSEFVPVSAERLIKALNWAVSNFAQDIAMQARENPKRPLPVIQYDDQDTFKNHVGPECYLLHYKMHQAAIYRAQELLEGVKVFIKPIYHGGYQ